MLSNRCTFNKSVDCMEKHFSKSVDCNVCTYIIIIIMLIMLPLCGIPHSIMKTVKQLRDSFFTLDSLHMVSE